MPRDPKITPITRHEPRTFYATRTTRTKSSEVWDLWAVEDGRRVGFLSVVDDGNVVYALATVKRGTSHEEIADLVDGFFPPSSTDATMREVVIADYDNDPAVVESDFASEEWRAQSTTFLPCLGRRRLFFYQCLHPPILP